MDKSYPITDVVSEIREKLVNNNILILQAPPGAGKSTILPIELMNEPWLQGQKILMLEPRRLAARSVAVRMSDLLNEEPGESIGYRVRFENRVSKQTKIEVLTEGILTRIIQKNNILEGVGLIIFDEFHERSIHADLALVLCREIQKILRDDLRILIMSATLNSDALSKSLASAPTIKSEGRQFPVQLIYCEPDQKSPLFLETAKIARRAYRETSGDLLVFLPGTSDIIKASTWLQDELPDCKVHSLYGDLPFSKQQEALMPDKNNQRKIVIATSIAETSLTIHGIKAVIDSGYSRIPAYDPNSGLTKLETVRVSKDVADQRAGRAGRLGPGICYRLWSEGLNYHLQPHRKPEILDADLAPLLLETYKWGEKNIYNLEWINKPPTAAVENATQLLQNLEAINSNGITGYGEEMAEIPAHPRIAHMMLEAKKTGDLSLACELAALFEEKDPLRNELSANIVLRIEALRKFRSKNYVNADKQLLERIDRTSSILLKSFNAKANNDQLQNYEGGKLVAAAYPDRIAKKLHTNRYRLVNGRTARISEHDSLTHEEFIAIANMDGSKNEAKIFSAAPLSIDDIKTRAIEKNIMEWNYQHGHLIAETQVRIGEIILQTKATKNINEQQAHELLVDVLRKEGFENTLNITDEITDWRNQVLSAKKWQPENEWPDVSLQQLEATYEEWLKSYLINIRKKEDFKKINVLEALQTLLTFDKNKELQKIAPAKLLVPSGSLIPLKYQPDGSAPILAVRLQELFGLTETPTVNNGKIKALIHMLSPGYKPVQVTQDLKSFWNNTYPIVRRELKIRYPRHHWPEDPWTAEAVRGAKKRNT